MNVSDDPVTTGPGEGGGRPLRIYVDADSCPVKDEVYKVARRHDALVHLVTNRWFRIPDWPWLTLEVIRDRTGLDVVDDRIVELAETNDAVVTEDILLAQRCIEKGARVLTPRGHEYSPVNIGEAVASRELLADLREAGHDVGGPSRFDKRDRSRFLREFEELLRRIERDRDA